MDKRMILRIVGPSVVGVGLFLTFVGLSSFFALIPPGGSPRFFWTAFIGFPLIGFGVLICQHAYTGVFQKGNGDEPFSLKPDAGRSAGKDTREPESRSKKAVAESRTPLQAGRCPGCGSSLSYEDKFCTHCGKRVTGP